jgi:uncharacterized protein YjiS (DUF1127 family)
MPPIPAISLVARDPIARHATARLTSPTETRLRRVGLARQVLALLALWFHRGRERRQLMAMNARERRDLGVTDLEVRLEVNKPFWRG